MSKYKEVYNDIREKITNGTFKAREFLESESELARKYSYSKDTIRKALSMLELDVVSGIKEIMDIFEVSEEVSFYKVSRIRILDGEALEYETTYFDRRIVPFLDKKIAESSTYDYLEKKLHLKISHSRRDIKFRYATEDEKKYMDLKNFDSVVVIESHTYLSNGTLFQYGINSYRPDKFAFSTVAKR